MALFSKLEKELEIKSPADKFFDVYMMKAHIVPKTSSKHMHHVEVHEGDFVSSEGKVQTMKGKIEVDEENKKVSSTAIEGDILKLHKSFKVTIEIIPKEGGSLVKWAWEYEKVDDQVADPKKFLDLAVNITKDVDAYIIHHMAVATMETEVEIKSSADKFFKTYLTEAHLVAKTASDHNVHGVEVHEGDFHSSGSIKQWTYNLDGKLQRVKGKIIVDDENKKVTSTITEGDALEKYKSFQITLQVFPKDGEGSLVKWTWDYEKACDDVPEPTKFRDLAVNITKDVDAHIVENA